MSDKYLFKEWLYLTISLVKIVSVDIFALVIVWMAHVWAITLSDNNDIAFWIVNGNLKYYKYVCTWWSWNVKKVTPASGVKDRYGAANKWLPKFACGKAHYVTVWEWRVGGLRADFASCKWFYKCDINLCYRWAKGQEEWEDRRGLSACHLSDFLTFDITFPYIPLRMPLRIWERGPWGLGEAGEGGSSYHPVWCWQHPPLSPIKSSL